MRPEDSQSGSVRIKNPDFINGEVILINKDLDWTSFDVVNSLRIFLKYEFKIKKIKVGHAGTLDPKATGLVIICTGKKTKEIESYQAQEKEYTGTFYLGKPLLRMIPKRNRIRNLQQNI